MKAYKNIELQQSDEGLDKQSAIKADGLERFLLSGPVLNKEELKVIKANRKAINRWRTI